jgi:ubiquinone/menaquinone biosynthesis C-methylase UbiE
MPECLKKYDSAPTRGRTLDYAAGVYDVLSPLMTFGQEKRIGKIAVELLDLKGHEKIIDIGCGTGSLTIDIAGKLSPAKGGQIIGIDAAAKMIAMAQKKASGIGQAQFCISAAEHLEYPDETFDCAISTFFFHHIDFELKLQALNEIWRTLKNNGKVVIVDVDTPTNIFGKICAWSGYVLFQQHEIKENIEGKLRDAIVQSKFRQFELISSHMGYVSIFALQKKA